MKLISKVKNKIKINKKLGLFLVVLMIVGIAAGSLFVTILNNSDKNLVSSHLNLFLDNIVNGQVEYFSCFKNNLIIDLGLVLAIWFLGISIIGLPIIIFIFFSKSFILGFSIGSILSVFKTKGIIFSLIYIFPGNIINLLIMLILCIYSLSFSIYLLYAVFKKKTVDFKELINKYTFILIISIVITVVMCLYNSYLMPKLIKSFINLIR